MLCYQLLLFIRLIRQYLHLQYPPLQVSENSAPSSSTALQPVSMRPIVSTTMTGIAMHNKKSKIFFTISSPLSRIYAEVTVTAMTKMMHQLLIVLFFLVMAFLFCQSQIAYCCKGMPVFIKCKYNNFSVFFNQNSHLKTA